MARWKGNCVLDEEQTAAEESNIHRRLGGATCIECKTEWLPEGAR